MILVVLLFVGGNGRFMVLFVAVDCHSCGCACWCLRCRLCMLFVCSLFVCLVGCLVVWLLSSLVVCCVFVIVVGCRCCCVLLCVGVGVVVLCWRCRCHLLLLSLLLFVDCCCLMFGVCRVVFNVVAVVCFCRLSPVVCELCVVCWFFFCCHGLRAVVVVVVAPDVAAPGVAWCC